MTDNKNDVIEKQTKISDFTTIALTEKSVKELEKIKRKIKNETDLNITNANAFNIVIDCIDENKLSEKIKLLKTGVGK